MKLYWLNDMNLKLTRERERVDRATPSTDHKHNRRHTTLRLSLSSERDLLSRTTLGTGLARTEILSRLSLVKSVAHGRKWANKGQCPEREGAVRLSAAALFDSYFGTMTSARMRISATTNRPQRRAGARGSSHEVKP